MSHWSGGPDADHTLKDTSGGYAYFETSFKKPPKKARALTLGFVTAVIDNITNSDYATSFMKNLTKSQPVKEQRIFGLLDRVTTFKQTLKQQMSQNINAKLTAIANSLTGQAQVVLDAIPLDSLPERIRPGVPRLATLYSAKIPSTKPQGHCMQFYYMVYGLSAEKMTVFVEEASTGKRRKLWETFFDSQERWLKMEIR